MDGMERMPVNILGIPYLFRTLVNAAERGFYSYSGSQIFLSGKISQDQNPCNRWLFSSRIVLCEIREEHPAPRFGGMGGTAC